MRWLFVCLTFSVSLASDHQKLSSPSRRLTYIQDKKIETARLFGDLDMFAYYFVDLMVGTPPQRTSVIVDTGSTVGAFPCSVCTHCGHHLDSAFIVEKSSTLSWVKCGDSKCHGTCGSDNHCEYHQAYREGSGIKGWFFEDKVSFGDWDDSNPAVSAVLGCHTEETKLFFGQKANGILGMAPHRSGKSPTLLETLFATPEISKDMFSLCFAPLGGQLTVGGWDSQFHTGNIEWINMQVSQYYSVFPSGVLFDDRLLGTEFGKTILDSGTTYTYLPSAIYNGLVSNIRLECETKRACGSTQRRSDTCYSDVTDFPPMTWRFPDNRMVKWPAKNGYMYSKKVNGVDSWCFSFENSGSILETVLGASFMINFDVIFDLRENKIGLAPAHCPVNTVRPDYKPTWTPSKNKEATNSTIPNNVPDNGQLPVNQNTKSNDIQTTTSIPISSDTSPVVILLIFSFGLFGTFFWLRRKRLRASGQYGLVSVIGAPVDEESGWPQVYREIELVPSQTQVSKAPPRISV